MHKKIILLSLIPILVTTKSLASTYNDGFYIGGQIGWTYLKNVCMDGYISCSDEKLSYGAFGGYQINKWLSFELGVYDYNKEKTTYEVYAEKNHIWGGELTANLSYPFTDKFSAYTRLGATYLELKQTIVNSDIGKNDSSSYPIGAIGLSYNVMPQISFRAEYKYIPSIGSDKIDLNTFGVAMIYHFAPKTTIAPVNIPVITKTVLTGDLNFESGSSDLKNYSELDELAKTLSKYTGFIKIAGYTDSSGQANANQKLSDLRAIKVAKYLHSKGIDSRRIVVQGFGANNPVADNSTALGRSKNRRVEVDFETE